jgi:hypothetical protein
MPRARCTFRQRDVTAALKGAVAAGVPVRGVRINVVGDIELLIGRPLEHNFSAVDRNEWDDELNGGDQAEVR